MADNERIVILVTRGPDEPELASIAFAMAGGAVASDVEVVMGFQGPAVLLMKKGVAETIAEPEFVPVAQLIETLRGFDAKFLLCTPCAKARGLAPDDFVDGAELVAAGRFIAEVTSATNALVY
jgi:predicted peroxiredoxin